jgi:hypothetical protein
MKANNPHWVFHPATFVHGELIIRKISKRKLLKAGKKYMISYYCLYYFLNYEYTAKSSMQDVSEFLEHYLGIHKNFWINSYNNYNEAINSDNYRIIKDGEYKFFKEKHQTLERINNDAKL